MVRKFLNYYRVPSARLTGYDYGSSGLYFITICSYLRMPLFGSITNDVMELNDFGQIVLQEWNKSFQIRQELFCDTFVIMSNHIHAIVGIDVETSGGRLSVNKTETSLPAGRQGCQTETSCQTSLRGRNPNLIQPRSLSSFVGGFKAATTKQINRYRKISYKPVWQTRFYDRIIRNEKEYFSIREYIVQNPQNWHKDRNNIQVVMV